MYWRNSHIWFRNEGCESLLVIVLYTFKYFWALNYKQVGFWSWWEYLILKLKLSTHRQLDSKGVPEADTKTLSILVFYKPILFYKYINRADFVTSCDGRSEVRHLYSVFNLYRWGNVVRSTLRALISKGSDGSRWRKPV